MRLIDADYVKSKLNKAALGGHVHYYVCGVIDDAPTIEAEPVKHGELLAKIKDLIAKYKQAESGMIWETSGSIEEDEEKLEIECKELRKYFEKALGGAE